jgi:tellurite resistance protein
MFLSTLNQAQKEAVLCLAHNVAVSDGEFQVGEEMMMNEMRSEMNLDPAFDAHYLELAGIELIFPTKRSREIVMISLTRLAYADGAFEIEEQCFLSDLSTVFNISDENFQRIDNWVRRLISLEKEAQDFL